MTNERTEPVQLNITEGTEGMDVLEDLMESHDVVVSLLPWSLHPKIAEK